jgi:hypothetical protein
MECPDEEGLVGITLGRIRRLSSWKCPGPDNLPNFWIKRLDSLHQVTGKVITKLIRGEGALQAEMCEGITYMLPKTPSPTSAKEYRPITCLNTMYKLITSVLTDIIRTHLDNNQVLTENQLGSAPGTLVAKEQCNS